MVMVTGFCRGNWSEKSDPSKVCRKIPILSDNGPCRGWREKQKTKNKETGEVGTYLQGSGDGILRTLNKGGSEVWKE